MRPIAGAERVQANPFITTAPPPAQAQALARRGAATIGIATLALVAVAAFAGFGSQGRAGPLAWSGDAQVFRHPTIPSDRVLTGTLRNDGSTRLRVDIADVRLLADGERPIPSTAVFLKASGRSLWATGGGPQLAPNRELQRTGRIALLSPGEELALTVAWHAADGAPERVDYGAGSLAVPG